MTEEIHGLILEHTSGAAAGQTCLLQELFGTDLDGPIIFGRDPSCDVCFHAEGDRRASARHTEMRFENGVLVLRDLGSSNGTFVNGRRITHGDVKAGDRIRFGEGGPEILLRAPAAHGGQATQSERRVARTELYAPPPKKSSPAMSVEQTLAAPPRPEAAGQAPGRRTVMVMIQQAVHAAQGKPGTQFLQAVVDRATGASRRTTRKYAATLAVLIAVVAGGILAKTNHDQGLLRVEVMEHIGGVEQALVSQLAATNSSILAIEGEIEELQADVANAATREELEQLGVLMEAERDRARRLEAHLAQTRAQVTDLDDRAVQALRGFREVAGSVEKALYLLAVHFPDLGLIDPFCSSFAVRSDGLLYTNAHCDEAFDTILADARERGLRAVPIAIQNGDPDAIYVVESRGSHPRYGSDGIDLAYLRLAAAGPLPQVIRIADREELGILGPGYEIAVFGYPGEFMETEPVASFLTGTIGRITEGNTLIQHSALTSGGTSGSPILNRRGEVVGIHHAARYDHIMTVATDAQGNVILNRDGSPRMRPLSIRSAGRAFGIHGRHLADWLGSLN